MLPGDLKGSPDESFSSRDTIVFIDEAFLSKLSKYFGQGKYLKFDRVEFAKMLAKSKNLTCQEIFLYAAPPFQSNNPSKEEEIRKEGYDRFIKKLKEKEIIVREGRCQKLNIDNKITFKQKYVDVLITIDLMKVPIKYKKIEKIILCIILLIRTFVFRIIQIENSVENVFKLTEFSIISSDSDFVPAINALKEFNVKTILFTYYEKGRKSNFSRSNELIKSVHTYTKLSKEDMGENPKETK